MKSLVWGLLIWGMTSCTLLESPGTSWHRPYPVNQVLVTERYWLILTPRSLGSGTQLVFCLKQRQSRVAVVNARVLATVAWLDQSVESLDLRYEPGSQCYQGILPQSANLAQRFLLYVQVGNQRDRLMFQR